MDSYVDAALRMQAALRGADPDDRRQLGPRPARRRRRRGRTSTSSTSSSASSIAGCKGVRQRRRRRAGRSSGSSATTPTPEPFPAALAGALAGGRAPIPHPSARRARRGGSAAARCRWSADSRPTRRSAGDGIDRYRAPPTIGTRAALSWGAGGPPNGLGRDLRPDEAFGPTYTTAPLDEPLSDPRRSRGRPPPGGLGARSRPRSSA